MNAADGSRNLKKELQAKFPGIKFSVKSKVFSGGDDINVSYELGPTTKEVEAIANKYQEGNFDGMIDLYTYNEDQSFTSRNGGAKYVFVDRHIPNNIYYDLVKQYAADHNGQGHYCESEPWNSFIEYSNGKELIIRVMNIILQKVDFRKVKEFKLVRSGVTCGLAEDFYLVA